MPPLQWLHSVGGVATTAVTRSAGAINPLAPVLQTLSWVALRLPFLRWRVPGSRNETVHSFAGRVLRTQLNRFVPSPFHAGGLTLHKSPSSLFSLDMALNRYEPATTKLITESLTAGMTFVDVGAHIGWYTLHAARRVQPHGHVVALEPAPGTATLLRSNVAANRFEGVVSVVQKAVAAEDGMGRLYLGAEDGRNSLFEATGDAGGVSVELVTLDRCLSDLGITTIDLMKIDVEGGETLAFRGLKRTAAASPTLRIIMEFVPSHIQDAGLTTQGLFDVLREMGFVRFRAITEGDGLMPLDLPRDLPRLTDYAATHAGWPNILCEREQ